MDLAAIGYKENTNAGIAITIYFAKLSEIDTANFPQLRTDGTVYQNAIETDSASDINFTVVGDGFYSISALMPDKSNATSTLEGDKGGKTESNVLNAVLTGTDVDVRGFMALTKNTPGVVLYKDNCGGAVNMIGCDCQPAYISEGELDTGAAPGDQRGTTISFSASGKPILIYTGAITPAS